MGYSNVVYGMPVTSCMLQAIEDKALIDLRIIEVNFW